MGACLSTAPKQLIEVTDGGEESYHKRYMEGEVLGEGEFGQVRLVHDMTQGQDQNTPYASKVLKKGMVFKDNTLYSPIKVSACVALLFVYLLFIALFQYTEPICSLCLPNSLKS